MRAGDGRSRRGLRTLASGYFGQIPILLGLRPAGRYVDLDEKPVRPWARVAAAIRLIVLAPVLLPVGAGVQAYRAVTRGVRSGRRQKA